MSCYSTYCDAGFESAVIYTCSLDSKINLGLQSAIVFMPFDLYTL